jgi:Holliday junction resolvase RusA-like endonuclease
MTTLTLRLSLPCPLNSLYRAMHIKGRKHPQSVLSKRARIRRDLIVGQILKQTQGMGRPIFTGPVSIADLTIVPRDRRTPDIDAFDKQLFDCLARAGVIGNDKQIVHRGSTERMPPAFPGHVSITITELECFTPEYPWAETQRKRNGT